ncbi:AI-2E family transporter [Paraburkholderia edwinii]|jgi:predicted PurR-regulated permease PerM|uniref:AI-2E family transporter n=1 Tax=Paraburkholderia edwinii TaxID=2861782 RepID=A0ABX8ULG6_9BURK|nr:AI-2E family transporter [Paraburkholderia edwinii]QYD67885.1 AI-2E family transporter [Paraburkholderia edwinii]
MRNLKSFYILLFVVSLALVWILLPFFSAIFWGTILAVLFQPLQRRLTVKFGNRPNTAALTTLALCVLIVILPVGLLVGTLAQEATFAYNQIKTGQWDFGLYFQKAMHALPSFVQRWLGDVGLGDVAGLQAKLADGAAIISQFMAAQAVAIGQNTLRFAIGFGVMLYLVFFLLRDGIAISRRIREAVPLEEMHKRKLLSRFATVVRATVKGNVAVAVVQGLLGGLAFFVLGIKGALLWGTLMAFLSLLPAIGSALVWVPVAVYFLLAGPLWKAIVLTIFCTLVMGAVDNILRPVLVRKDTRLPDWVVLISTLGGVSVFGINGFVIGPLIAALFVSCWDISVIEGSDERTIPERVKRLEGKADVALQALAETSIRKP